MKYLNRMVVKLLTSSDMIDEQDKMEVLKEFDESSEKLKTSSNRILMLVNAVGSHAIGAMVMLWMYIKLKTAIRRAERDELDDSVEGEFKRAYKAQLQQEMLDDLAQG